MLEKRIRFYAIDASEVARQTGMGGRINTVMQTCFFAISGVLPPEQAIAEIKHAIEKTYQKRGAEVVKRNFEAVDATLAHLHEVPVPSAISATHARPPLVSALAPDFVQRMTSVLLAGKGDLLPVSAFPVDGTWPVGTAKWEKRNLALEIPVWDQQICIQCNQCVLVCPHAAIRAKVYDQSPLAAAPPTFKSVPYKGREFKGRAYTIQVAPEDCTGCNLCVHVCPAKDRTNPRHKAIDMHPQAPLRDAERINYAFFLDLPDTARGDLPKVDHKLSQFLEPLFEYSGACAGCGETPYIKLLTQLFGDRALVANATGCSSIYGGNLPTTPFTTNREGRGPAWANSLFEDNAEFGLGIRLGVDSHARAARALVEHLAAPIGERLSRELLTADQSTEAGIQAQRERVRALRQAIALVPTVEARRLEALADYLVKKSIWLVGGDGWAYDIGYGGLDHVLASQCDVNILVLDTEVYSNTGGQQSKATPLGAVAKFASAGKRTQKKDLGLLANMYGHVYVARVAFGAKMSQTVQAFLEAEAYPGPSLIIAYSHCIAHGYDMADGATQQKLAVDSGVWPLYRFDPRRSSKGERPMRLDYGPPKPIVAEYMRNESRFRVVERTDPVRFRQFLTEAQEAARQRYALYEQLAGISVPPLEVTPVDDPPSAAVERGGIAMDLGTEYVGIKLPHPLVVGASPLADDLDSVKRLEDAGAAAIVLRSLFEEQITREQISEHVNLDSHGESFAEALTFFPSPHAFALGPFQYLEHLRRTKEAVGIPVLASLNGATPGGWIEDARLMQQAGADALELNLYRIVTDPETDGEDIERQAIEIVREVKKSVTIPVAVKLSPFYTAFAHFARELDRAGADALVIFNRFYQPDIDAEQLAAIRTLHLSDSSELRLRLHWLAILCGRVRASLAVTGGVHSALDVIKATMAGAHVTQMVSALLMHGPGHLRKVREDLAAWMTEHEWSSLAEMRGNMSLFKVPDPDAYERANYMLMLQGWRD